MAQADACPTFETKWDEAIYDAQAALLDAHKNVAQATRRVARLRVAIRLFHELKRDGATWPVTGPLT